MREVNGDGQYSCRSGRHGCFLTNVRIEQVQDISVEDALHEGCRSREAFAKVWDELNKNRGFGWETNPWVFVIGFERKIDEH